MSLQQFSGQMTISIVFILLFAICGLRLDGQVLLQLEINKEVDAIKFGYGDVIMIKSKSSDGEWQKRKLERLIVDQNLIVFEDGMMPLEDITHLRMINGTADAAGKLFLGFGAGWLVFGGIAHVASDYKFTWGTVAIGAVSMGIGWLFQKVASKRTFKMGKNANLRIIDISFPEPEKIPIPSTTP